MLRGLGVGKGDRVVIYMPMIPEAVIAMLACARIGAVHSVVFGGFAPHELATRIDDARPAVIVVGILRDRADPRGGVQTDARRGDRGQRTPTAGTVSSSSEIACAATWSTAATGLGRAHRRRAARAAVPVAATDPALHPVHVRHHRQAQGHCPRQRRSRGGAAVEHAPHLRHRRPGDVFWAASDVGWVVGHSYIVYGPLLAGATTVLYEGKPVGTPDPGAFWRVVRNTA